MAKTITQEQCEYHENHKEALIKAAIPPMTAEEERLFRLGWDLATGNMTLFLKEGNDA